MNEKQTTAGRPRLVQSPLSLWLDAAGLSRGWLSTRFGVHRNTVDRWCNGSRRPRLEDILKIDQLTCGSVSPRSWI